MARKWPATIEIGYWVHVDQHRPRLATRASRALTNAALGLDGITTVCIRCDEANVRSAAVPRGLGFTLVRTETRTPEAPAETGQLMIWERSERVAEQPGSAVKARRPSMRSIVGASRRSITSRATRFSRNWSTRLAPVITVDTCGFFAHHAIDSLRQRAIEIVRDRLEPAHPVLGLLVVHRVVQPLVAGERAAAAVGDAVEVLAGEHARRERAVRGETEPDVVVEPQVLELDPPARSRLYCGCSITGLCR